MRTIETHARLRRRPGCPFALAALLCLLVSHAPAATRTWNGGGADNLWTNAANWGGTAPVAGDDLVFPGTAPADSLANTNNFAINTTFGSITFTGTNYNLSFFGSSIILTNGISHQSGGTNTVGSIIFLGANQTFENTVAAGVLILSGDFISLNTRNLTLNTTGRINIARTISGSGNLIMKGAGTLRLLGAGDNTYVGSMTVEAGLLELNKPSGAEAIPGALTIGDGTGAVDSAIVRLLGTNQVNDSSVVTIEDDGWLDLNGNSDAISSLTVTGGDVTTGAGTLTLGGDVTANASTNTAIISGNLSLGSATRSFSIAAGTASPDLTISAVISGNAGVGITKTGSGLLRFSGTNTYSGVTMVNSGIFDVSNPSALGSPSSGTILPGSGILLLSGVTVAGETLTNTSIIAELRSTGAAGWSGNVVLNSTLEIQVFATTFHLSGIVSGAGGLIKLNTGTLILSGPTDNTYAGTTTVNDGVLELNKTAGAEAIPGALTIGDSSGAIGSAIVRLLGTNQVNGVSPVTIEDDGLLDLNGNSDAIGSLTVTGGDVATGAGTLTLGGDVTANASTNTATISGNLSLGSAMRNFSIAAGTAIPDLTISAVISGNAGVGIAMTGLGNFRLSGANTYSGVTTVSSGLLDVVNPSALGSASSGTTLSGSAFLFLNGVTVAGETLTNASPFAFMQSSGPAGWSGNVVLNATLQVLVLSSTNEFSGAISGTGGLTKTQPGTLILSGPTANTYAGTTTVNTGLLLLNKSPGVMAIPGALVIGDGAGGVNADVVRLQANSQISDTSTITINNSGVLDSDGFTEVAGALSGTGNLQLDNSTFTASLASGPATFDGVISGSNVLSKAGADAWTLNGTNTFSGAFQILAGTVFVNGLMPANQTGVSGTLGGTGTVGHVSVGGGGTISPGLSPGRLTTSNLAFIVTSKFRVELNGTNAGSDYDQLKVNGTINNLASATLNATLGFPSAISNSFTIIDNDGTDAVTNTFSGLPEGATVNVSGTPFRISYVGGSGNDVVLTQLAATQQPLLKIQRSGTTNVVLSWPTIFTGFTLEANTNLNTNVWGVVAPAPAVSGTNNVVTNTASGPEKLYRLRAP